MGKKRAQQSGRSEKKWEQAQDVCEWICLGGGRTGDDGCGGDDDVDGGGEGLVAVLVVALDFLHTPKMSELAATWSKAHAVNAFGSSSRARDHGVRRLLRPGGQRTRRHLPTTAPPEQLLIPLSLSLIHI